MPFVSQYIDALSISPLPFNTLKNIVFDNDFRNTSSRALTLKGVIDGENYAVKFFTSPSDALMRRYRKLSDYHLDFVPDYIVYEKEINIVNGEQFEPQLVILGHWVEGISLSDEIRKLCHNHDKDALTLLCDKMINLFLDLMDTDIVHGDLKFDNIIVRDDGRLIMIDWDAYYSPDLANCPSFELGTIFFQHPGRTTDDYGRRVDDYSIVCMVVTMVAYSEQPELYGYSSRYENVLLSPEEIINGESEIYSKMCMAWQYFPLRLELLRFLQGNDFHLPNLKKVLQRMAGRDKFDERIEMMIDNYLPIRRIVNKTTKLYGYIDSNDNVIIDTMYGDSTMFGENITGVRINGNWFFIDKRGRRFPNCYQRIIYLGMGRFSVKKENHWFELLENDIIIWGF